MLDLYSESGFEKEQEKFVLNVSGNEITLSEYDETVEDIQFKRTQLNKERKQYTDALIRLGHDREALL
ncbi:5625_t:CDS:2, partial [Scutellospora calospora]